MNQASMRDVPRNMRLTGMLLFRDALMEALYDKKPMCVVHAAHAAEILLKARIAQEHPLLIFSKLPKSDRSKDTLTLIDLLENGRTLSYEELPDQLWATTGIKIERLNQYREFGRLRNQLIHFSMTNVNELDVLTVRYSLEVLDPLVEGFWGRSVIDFITNDPHDYYAGFVSSGLLEDSIRKIFPIDERLRRLLGEVSKKGWEKLQAYNEEWEEYHKSRESMPEEVWNMQAEEYNLGKAEAADNRTETEDLANWKDFLGSF